MFSNRFLLLIGLVVMVTIQSFSQIQPQNNDFADQIVNITMKNGDVFEGTVQSSDSLRLILLTDNGEMSLNTSQIRTITKRAQGQKYSFINPHDTRTFFGPTGIPIKKGSGYYQNLMISSNLVNYGITDNISVGGGFEFISTILGNPIWYLSPKAGFQVGKNSHIGTGIFVAGYAGEGSASIAYGVYTHGHSDSNITGGIGFGFSGSEFLRQPVLMLSGLHRVSRNVALMTENYYLRVEGENLFLGMYGVRLLSPKNAFDLGFIFIPEIAADLPLIPYVGYARAF